MLWKYGRSDLARISGLEHTEIGRRHQFSAVVDVFRRTLLRELDFQREAAHLQTLRRNLAEFDRIRVACTGRKWPSIPIESGHRFRLKARQ